MPPTSLLVCGPRPLPLLPVPCKDTVCYLTRDKTNNGSTEPNALYPTPSSETLALHPEEAPGISLAIPTPSSLGENPGILHTFSTLFIPRASCPLLPCLYRSPITSITWPVFGTTTPPPAPPCSPASVLLLTHCLGPGWGRIRGFSEPSPPGSLLPVGLLLRLQSLSPRPTWGLER